MSETLLSVCLITYNHRPYIKQAIESVLQQKVNFAWEFIIAEDCSTDGTREIVKEYAEKYPEKIKLILQERNVGPAKNWMDLIIAPIGKYIAYFEGDDYWTDPLKLQKQVDFLEANPDFAICFHRVKILRENTDNAFEELFPSKFVPEETTFEDLSENNFIPTLSCVYRNRFFRKFPDWFEKSPAGDYPLHLLNAEHGKLKYFDDVMGHYRIHGGGVWSLIGDERKNAQWLEVLNFCRDHFYPKGARGFENQLSRGLIDICFYSFQNGHYKEFRSAFLQLIKQKRINSARILMALTARYLVSYQVNVANLYKKVFCK